MSQEQYTDADWQKKLSEPAYRALRHGEMESPNTGRYVTTELLGLYYCVGCGAPLFDSSAKINDGSGYATFREPLDPQSVSSVTNYSLSGEQQSGFVCTNCGGHIGLIDNMELNSADDLEQGTTQRLYHASSNAVILKKALSPRNYPVGTLLLIVVCVVGYLAWSWGSKLVDVSYLGRASSTIPLWVGDAQVFATPVHLDRPNASTSGMVVRQNEALLIIFGSSQGVPAIRFANHSVDILWLDRAFKVVGWEHERASQSSQALDRPKGAEYALIAQPGTIAPSAFATGYEIIVTDRSSLI
jgi:peptide-methionine (R)-S-oxide reductase